MIHADTSWTPIDGGEKLEDITGFCLSGGGYRAIYFMPARSSA